MRLLDTDVLIDFQRKYPPALAWYNSLTEVPSVPGLVIMELIQDAQNRRQVQAVLRLVMPMPVVWPTETDCARALSDFTAFHLPHNASPGPPLGPRKQAGGEPAPAATAA